MKNRIDYITPYLPFAVKAEMLNYKVDYTGEKYDLIRGVYLLGDRNWHCETGGGSRPSINDVKLILKPISDLFKDGSIQELRELVDNDMLLWGASGFVGNLTNVDIYKADLTFSVLEYLHKNHFDIYGLIPNGLAVEKNHSPVLNL